MVEAVNNFLSNNVDIIFLCLTSLCIILIVVCVSQEMRLSNLNRRVERFLGGRKERRNLENRLADYSAKVNRLDEKYDELRINILDINKRLSYCIQKVGFVRYNPFDDMGGDYCFALALLDENDYGVVINTIHGRESSYTYAKSIVGLECKYTLSNEEKAAVMLAIENKGLDEVLLKRRPEEKRVTVRRKVERVQPDSPAATVGGSAVEGGSVDGGFVGASAGNEVAAEIKNETPSVKPEEGSDLDSENESKITLEQEKTKENIEREISK